MGSGRSRVGWILAGAALALLGWLLWVVVPARDGPRPDAGPFGGDAGASAADAEHAPALRAARTRFAEPRAVEFYVRTSAGAPPPRGTHLIVTTPGALLYERKDQEGWILRHEGDHNDFEGHVGRIEDVRYATWEVLLVAPGHFGVRRELTLPIAPSGEAVPPGETIRVELVLETFAALAVRVRNEQGEPVGGCQISVLVASEDGGARAQPLYGDPSRPLHPDDRRARAERGQLLPGGPSLPVDLTDGRGEFFEPFLPADTALVLQAEHPDYPPLAMEVRTPGPGERRDVPIVLETPACLQGAVDTAAFGAPPEAIVLTLYHHTPGTEAFQRRVPIAPDGSFFLRNIKPGVSTLQASARLPGRTTTALRRAEVPRRTTIDLGLIGPDVGPPLRITVHADAPYPRGARVRAAIALYPDPEHTPAHLTSMHQWPTEFVLPLGQEHELRGLAPGALGGVCLLVDPEGGDAMAQHRAARFAVDLGARQVPVEVVIERRPAPSPTVATVFRCVPPPEVALSEFRWRVVGFDADGSYAGGVPFGVAPSTSRVRGLGPVSDAPIRYTFLANGYLAGPYLREPPVEPASGEETVIQAETWARAAEISVVARDEAGQPVPGVELDVLFDEAGDHPLLAGKTGADGVAAFTVIPGRGVTIRCAAALDTDARRMEMSGSALSVGGHVRREVVVRAKE
ncbi:MAG: hypothetical protein O2894_10180 [Planctomycetota bacterium]|nr:hypothetical protein [Planctomycetota bacterium]